MTSKAVVFGDISPNVVDGSSIWLASITEVLANIFDEVHLQLKMPAQNDRIVGRLRELENIFIHTPDLANGQALTTDAAADTVEKLVAEIEASAVIVRGMDACNSFSKKTAITPILWSYVTDLPFPPERLSKNAKNRLNRIALRSRRLFAQTEAARSYLESITPHAAGKCLLLNPMIPASAFLEPQKEPIDAPGRVLRLIYAGKLAKDWKTLEMLELPRVLRSMGVEAELAVVGDKFNRAADDRTWVGKMQQALNEANEDPDSGVRWLGGMSRLESIQQIQNADIGIGWRTSALDSTLEISTKALEYSASGTVPLININGDHLGIFGADYPLFVRGDSTVEDAARTIIDALPALKDARNASSSVAGHYSMERSIERLRESFTRAGSLAEPVVSQDKTNLLVVSHDLKFMGEILPQLERDNSLIVKRDDWESLHHHDAVKSAELAKWADTIFCEFAGPSVAWFSKNKREGTKLISRLHGFELRSRAPWLKEIDYPNVDQWIVVSDLYKELALDILPVEPDRVHVVPNTVDLKDFDRQKQPNAQFHLGLVGMVPFLKRPDRALDLVELLLKEDDRYVLHFKGRMPWDYPHEWKKPVQKQLYLEFFNRIAENASLRSSIVFDPFSADIANWHRGIGFILSPSDVESFHLAPAEGMAARTLPIFWKREGVREIFGNEFLYENVKQAAAMILGLRDEEQFKVAGDQARQISERWDIPTVYSEWQRIMNLP